MDSKDFMACLLDSGEDPKPGIFVEILAVALAKVVVAFGIHFHFVFK